MKIIFYLFLLTYFAFCNVANEFTEDKIYSKLLKINSEKDAVKLLNDGIYNNAKITNNSFLRLLYERKWMKASRLVIDFMMDVTSDSTQNQINELVKYMEEYIFELKSLLQKKKKNIVKVSPIFEWSQDNSKVKIRLKFAKNLESPGEKDIQNFKVNCTRNRLEVQGYKEHEDYVAYYYRNIHLYEFIRPATCEGYKETDGSYIIKFDKNQQTLYWLFLDQITDDHHNTYTWFDVFTAYDDKVHFTDYRDMVGENLLIQDLEEYVKDKQEEKKIRLKKISNFLHYLKTKDYENKNYCNSPINENFCLLNDIYSWNYWLS